MQSTLREIPQDQLHAISGGHAALGVFSTVMLVLEIPHMIVGIREFTNYVADRWVNGGQNIEDGDYFTQFFANLFGKS
jgi:hypothetical protein